MNSRNRFVRFRPQKTKPIKLVYPGGTPGFALHGFCLSISAELCISGAARYEPCKPVADEAPNMTDVDDSLKQMRNDSPSLKELNLNNIKVSPWTELGCNWTF